MRARAPGAAALLVTLGVLGWVLADGGLLADGSSSSASRDPSVEALPALGVVTPPTDSRDTAPLASGASAARPVAMGLVAPTRVRLVDELGRPLARVDVQVLAARDADADPGREDGEPWRRDLSRAWQLVSDAAGELALPPDLPDVPPGEPRALVVARHGARAAVGLLVQGQPLELRLGECGRPRLRVTLDARPVADVPVALRLAAGETDGPWLGADVLGRTGPDGTFDFGLWPPRAIGRLLVLADGHAPVATGAASASVTEVRLEPPRRIEGRLVDARGVGIPDARVTLTAWAATNMLGCGGARGSFGRPPPPPLVPGWIHRERGEPSARHTRTDAAGSWSLPDWDGRFATVSVWHPGFAPGFARQHDRDGGVLVLEDDETLLVMPTDDAGRPVVADSLRAWWIDDDGQPGTPLPTSAEGSHVRVHRTAGREVHLEARAGARHGVLRVAAGAGERVATFPLQRGAQVAVRVLDDGGQPVDVGALALRWQRETVAELPGPDAAGVYTFVGLAPDTYSVSAPLSSYGRPPPEPEHLEHAPWRLPAGWLALQATSAGVTEVRGERMALLDVELHGDGLADTGHRLRVAEQGGSGYGAGTQQIGLTGRGREQLRLPVGAHDVELDGERVGAVVLAAGERRTLRLDVPRWPRVRGRVHRGGRAVGDVLVLEPKYGSARVLTRCDADGRFEVVWHTRRQLLFARQSAPGVTGWQRQVDLPEPDGEDLVLDIDLGSLSQRVRVVDPEGRPVVGAAVVLDSPGRGWPARDLPLARARTDARGEALFEHLQPDRPYRAALDVDEEPSSAPHHERFELAAGGAPDTIQLVRRPGTRLQGRVIDGTGQRVGRGWTVDAEHESGAELEVDVEYGLFEFVGLAPGRWSLSVDDPRLHDARVWEVWIEPGEPAWLDIVALD